MTENEEYTMRPEMTPPLGCLIHFCVVSGPLKLLFYSCYSSEIIQSYWFGSKFGSWGQK